MKQIYVLDNQRMPPLTTHFTHFVKCIMLATTLCITAGFINVAAADNTYKGTVKARGTLGAIVRKNYIDASVSRNQIMVAILAANPHAFKGGNIHYMRGGRNLRLPTESSIAQISDEDASNLLITHNQFFHQGQTGNIPTPSFITRDHSANVDKLVKEKQQQDEKLDLLETERAKLRDLVERLEDEKAKRDSDLESLEQKIQGLNSTTSMTSDLKLKLNNGELVGEGAVLLENLQDKNESLNAQLQSARSEMAESTRMEISLERRMLDVQKENSLLTEALKERGVSPAEIKAQAEADDSLPTSLTMFSTQLANTSAPNSSLENVPPAVNTNNRNSIWIWLLPIIILLSVLALLWKIIAIKKKKKLKQRVQQSVDVDAFADYNRAIEKIAETEQQEPPLEVSIKMDVARAYIEASDYDNARQMLNEIMNEGSAQQLVEAQDLLQQIPQ